MKTTHILAGALLLAACAAGCSPTRYASTGSAYDDLYATHDRTAISQRKQAEAESRRARAEAAQAEWEARMAEARARAAGEEYYDNAADIVADSYSAYARRMRGFRSAEYRMPSSYYALRHEIPAPSCSPRHTTRHSTTSWSAAATRYGSAQVHHPMFGSWGHALLRRLVLRLELPVVRVGLSLFRLGIPTILWGVELVDRLPAGTTTGGVTPCRPLPSGRRFAPAAEPSRHRAPSGLHLARHEPQLRHAGSRGPRLEFVVQRGATPGRRASARAEHGPPLRQRHLARRQHEPQQPRRHDHVRPRQLEFDIQPRRLARVQSRQRPPTTGAAAFSPRPRDAMRADDNRI